MSDLASEIREVAITLPDGAVRRYPAGVTGAAIAADISKSLGKAALAVVVDGRLVGPVAADRRGCRPRHRHRQGRAGARADPPRLRPHHGPGGAGAVARRQGDDRPGDRERLVLRLRPRRAVHPGGPRRDRGADAADHRRRATRCAGRSGTATARSATTRRRTSPTRSSWSRRSPAADPIRMYWHGPVAGPLPRPAPRAHRQAAGRRVQADAVAGAYWRGDPQRPMLSASTARRCSTEAARRPSAPARGGGQARPPQDRRRRWTCSTSSRRRTARSSGTPRASRSGASSRPICAAGSTPPAMSRSRRRS